MCVLCVCCVCVYVCDGQAGRMAGRLPAEISGWQKMCRKEDVKGPRDREMASYFSYSSVLLLLGTGHIWKLTGSLNCFSESQQGGLEGDGKRE